jgi:hypothetical protein
MPQEIEQLEADLKKAADAKQREEAQRRAPQGMCALALADYVSRFRTGKTSGGIAGPAAEKMDHISVAMDSVRCLRPGNFDSGEQTTPSAFAIAMSTGPPTRKSCLAASHTEVSQRNPLPGIYVHSMVFPREVESAMNGLPDCLMITVADRRANQGGNRTSGL